MNIRLSAPHSAAEMRALEALYHAAFPPEERRAWADIVHPAVEGCPRMMAIYAGGVLAGIATVWKLSVAVYVEHLAVEPSQRGSGIGAAAVRALVSDAAPCPLLLEVEPESDVNPMAARRIAFYRRCGLEVLPGDYIQPSYGPGLPAVPMLLMSTDPQLDAVAAAAELHRRVYRVPV